jgi:two-component system, sensor histidine kinase PdtaS
MLLDRSDPLARILDLADDAIISVDTGHRIMLFNHGAERMFGYTAQEVKGKPLDILLPASLGEIHRQHIHEFDKSAVTSRRMGERSVIHGRRRDGSEFPAEASISKVEANGQTMFTVIMRDVTRRTQAEEQLKASVREKEALLKEIHHRVKNNLQVISSLLSLQARAVADETTRKKFHESRDRIQSMALLHESLYQSDSLAWIDFPEYIRQLADHLFRSYGVTAERIRLRTDLDRLFLNMDTAVPCGLIINEIISNSLKYAFPEGREGEIHVELREGEDGNARLSVADNGIGLDPGFDWVNARSLGLRLVRTLAQQLDAKLDVGPGPGTSFQLTFRPAA